MDWVTRPARAHVLIGKPIAIVGAAPGSKARSAQSRGCATQWGHLGAVVVGDAVAIPDIVNKVNDDGSYVDEVAEQLHALVSALVATLTEV